MLAKVYEEDCMLRACAFKWHKRFTKYRQDVEDNEHPCTSISCEIFEKEKKGKETETDQFVLNYRQSLAFEMIHLPSYSILSNTLN